MWAAFATTFFFALSAVCAQRMSKLLGGVRANFFRILLATSVLAAYAHLFGQGWSGGAFGWFFLSGIAGFGLGDVALYQALPRIGSRLSVMLVHCLAAPFAAFVEWLWLGTPLTALEILFALIALAGVALASHRDSIWKFRGARSGSALFLARSPASVRVWAWC